jgi:ABC-type lipoprotein export system ATPase subunit
LVKEPAVLLADEPTGNLDSETSAEIMDIIEGLNHREGLTVIFVTHEPEIARHAGRVVHMSDGRVDDDRVTR